MPRVFIPHIPVNQSSVELSGASAHYLITVLRLRGGDEFELFDSEGMTVTAVVKRASRGRVEAEIGKPMRCILEPHANIVLLQGMLKGQKMDLVVQKATELGVKEIVPLITERAVVKDTRKLDRWRKIAHDASRQCGRARPPEVLEPVGIGDFFQRRKGPLSGYVFWEEVGRPLSEIPAFEAGAEVVAAVGPEGGFTKDEVALARQGGLVVASLGSRILRAETAAISAVALIQFIHGGLTH